MADLRHTTTLAVSLRTKDAGLARLHATAMTMWSQTLAQAFSEQLERKSLTVDEHDRLFRAEACDYRDRLCHDPSESFRFGNGGGSDTLAMLEAGSASLIGLASAQGDRPESIEPRLRFHDPFVASVVRRHAHDPALITGLARDGRPGTPIRLVVHKDLFLAPWRGQER